MILLLDNSYVAGWDVILGCYLWVKMLGCLGMLTNMLMLCCMHQYTCAQRKVRGAAALAAATVEFVFQGR